MQRFCQTFFDEGVQFENETALAYDIVRNALKKYLWPLIP